VQGICLLERGSVNHIERIGAEDLLPMLRKQAYCPLDEGKHPAFLELTKILAQRVNLWKMACTKDPSAAQMAFDAMKTQ
jgi:hypothetical protein